MPAVLPQQGKTSFIKDIRSSSNAYALRLFQTSIVLGPGTILANFTEANFSGYVAAVPSWSLPVIDGSGRASITAAAMAFAHSGGAGANTIYGYYFVHTGTSEVLFCETFAVPKTMAVFGDSITITPTLTLDQG